MQQPVQRNGKGAGGGGGGSGNAAANMQQSYAQQTANHGAAGGAATNQQQPHPQQQQPSSASGPSPSSASPSATPAAAPDSCNIYIANLPPHWGEQQLADAFQPFGPVSLVKILVDANRISRGAGRDAHTHTHTQAAHMSREGVWGSDEWEAGTAIANGAWGVFRGDVRAIRPRADRFDPRRLCVCLSAGFVHLVSHDSALAAIRALDGSMVEGGVADPVTGMVRPLQVKFAHSKDAATRASASAAAAAAAAAGDGFGAHRAPHGRQGQGQGHGHSHGPSRGGGGGGVGGAGHGPVGTLFDEPNVYVAGLPKSLTRQGVEAIFAQFGRVSHVKVIQQLFRAQLQPAVAGRRAAKGLAFFPSHAPISLAIALAIFSRLCVPLSLSFACVALLFCVPRSWPRRRTLWHRAASPL